MKEYVNAKTEFQSSVLFSQYFFHLVSFAFPMSDYMPHSKTPDNHTNVSQVLEAVRSYIHDHRDSSIQYGSPNAYNAVNVLAHANRPSGYIAKVGFTSIGAGTTSTPPDGQTDMDDNMDDFVNMIYSNNQELTTILRLLKTSFPELLNEALLVVEEERSRRIQLEAELEVVREKWKEDIARQNEIISQKTDVISRMSRANRDETIGSIDLQRQLAEAHAEIQELRAVIRTIK
jgi:hypothetical protein